MGCWNGTCFLSHLPIYSGEDVKIILLEKNKYGEAFTNNVGVCEPDTFFKPIYFPISGKYDDYGGIEDIKKDYIIDLGLNAFKEYVGAEKSNQIYTDSRDKSEWSWENIWRSIERNVGKFYIEETDEDIEFGERFIGIMIRQDVWDSIIKIQSESKYGWGSETVEQYLNKDWNEATESNESNESNDLIRDWKRRDKFNSLFRFFNQKSLFDELYKLFSKSKLRDDKLTSLLENREINDIEIFKKYLLEINIININLGETRRIWGHNGSGAGSQSSNWKLYQKIYQVYQDISTNKIKEFESEWDEEYED